MSAGPAESNDSLLLGFRASNCPETAISSRPVCSISSMGAPLSFLFLYIFYCKISLLHFIDIPIYMYKCHGCVLLADVLLTAEHVKHVLSLEVQKADSLQLSVGRYILVENKSY